MEAAMLEPSTSDRVPPPASDVLGSICATTED